MQRVHKRRNNTGRKGCSLCGGVLEIRQRELLTGGFDIHVMLIT